MPQALWDASALTKRYAVETGTPTVNALFTAPPISHLVITRLGYAETFATLWRKRNRGLISEAAFRLSSSALQAEVLSNPTLRLLPIENAIISSTLYVERHNLNSADAAILLTYLRYAALQRCLTSACSSPPISACCGPPHRKGWQLSTQSRSFRVTCRPSWRHCSLSHSACVCQHFRHSSSKRLTSPSSTSNPPCRAVGPLLRCGDCHQQVIFTGDVEECRTQSGVVQTQDVACGAGEAVLRPLVQGQGVLAVVRTRVEQAVGGLVGVVIVEVARPGLT